MRCFVFVGGEWLYFILFIGHHPLGRYVLGLDNTIVSVKSPEFFHSSKK